MKYRILLLSILLTGCSISEQPQPNIEEFLTGYFEDYTPNFQHRLFDLNGDDQDELIVLAKGRNWCGNGGCTLFVFENQDGQYVPVSDSSISREPIRVSNAKSEGWYDLIVNTRGAGEVVMKFKNGEYPGNPSLQPQATVDEIVDSRIIMEKQSL